MTEEMWTAIIGVGGTLLGTALGWLLNVLSNQGKMEIFCKKWDVEFDTNDQGFVVATDDIEKAQFFNFNVELEVINHSSNTKIIRDVKIIFQDSKGKILKTIIPYDSALRTYSHHFRLDKEVKPFNVYGKSVLSIRLDKGFNNSDSAFDFIFNAEKVFLQYIDETNKVKRVLLKKGNIKDYYAIEAEGEN